MSNEFRDDWWWIDYLENEMDPGLEKDLQLLLENSQEDRDAFEGYRVLREWLLASDPIGDWPLEARMQRVRQGVMATIEKLPRPAKVRASQTSLSDSLSAEI
jgi:hypothetical protein